MTTLHLPTLAKMLSLDDEHMEYLKGIILCFAMVSQHYIRHELLCVSLGMHTAIIVPDICVYMQFKGNIRSLILHVDIRSLLYLCLIFKTNMCINTHRYILYSSITRQSAIASTYISYMLNLYIVF